jgi:hypothetical protein
LPEYLSGSPVEDTAVAVESPSVPVRRIIPTSSTRAWAQRDYSHIKGDLVRVMIITAVLVVILVALALAIS